MKNIAIIALLIAVIALGYFLIRKDTPDYQAPEDLGNTLTPDGGEEGETIKEINTFKREISEKEDFYTISAKYPELGIKSADDEILAMIRSQVAEFKEQNKEPYPGQTAPYTLNTDFRLSPGKGTTTIIFNIETYTGGAHGNLAVKTMTYDRTGSRIYLGSIFKPESSYIKKLSEISRKKLVEKIGTEGNWIDDGTEPISSNFESIYITIDNKLVIIFQPYQVAPWSAGLLEIEINLDEVGDIVDEKYR